MKNMTRITASLLLGSLLGCGSREFKTQAYSQAAKVTPHYSSISQNILIPKCVRCHSDSGGEHSLETWAAVRRYVDRSNSKDTELYKAVVSGEMPALQPSLSDDEVLAIGQWIDNGAPND